MILSHFDHNLTGMSLTAYVPSRQDGPTVTSHTPAFATIHIGKNGYINAGRAYCTIYNLQ